MGTRHLIAVFIDGEYKVAQYGQWDGYPEGQGIDVLHFLREKMDKELFKDALRNLSYITTEELGALWKEYGADDEGFVPLDGADAMKRDHPEFSRDTGAKILEIVQSCPGGMRLTDNISFAADSLFCEWGYVIDLASGTFEVYRGFNKEQPLTEEDRFFFLNDQAEGEYHPIKLAAIWDLNKLPTDEDFLVAFKSDEDEENDND